MKEETKKIIEGQRKYFVSELVFSIITLCLLIVCAALCKTTIDDIKNSYVGAVRSATAIVVIFFLFDLFALVISVVTISTSVRGMIATNKSKIQIMFLALNIFFLLASIAMLIIALTVR